MVQLTRRALAHSYKVHGIILAIRGMFQV